MLKMRTMLNVSLAAALVLGLCLSASGADETMMPTRVKTVITKTGSEDSQTALSLQDTYEVLLLQKTAELAKTTTEKLAAPAYVPSASTKQRATGDDCSDPIVLTLGSADLPYNDNGQTTCGRINDYDNTCLGDWDGGEDIIYELNLTEDLAIDISLDPKGTEFTGILLDYSCPADPNTCIAKSTRYGSDPHSMNNIALTTGTYYIMVDSWPSPDCIPEFDLAIELFQTSPGDDCNDPIVIKLPDDMTQGPNNNAYIDENQSNCGRGNDYDNTCLDPWDNGEDIIYQLDVYETVNIDIFLDPGPTNWSGILIDDNCPPDEVDCIQYSVIGTGAHGLYDLTLEPGIYYVMVDTYASPICIPSFTLTIQPVGFGPANDYWENCEPIGDVVDLPFSTRMATPDGPGGCLTSPNVWYCYTATCTGEATISLCGSSYNTKLAVYDGTNPFYDPLLGCNDASEACGEFSQQSQLEIEVIEGNTYLIGVGGWGDHTGDGILNVSCAPPPENDNCEDVVPVKLVDGVPVTFTGDNTHASHQCDIFDGAHTWHAFTLDTTMNVTLDYCTTDPAFTNAWLNLTIGCPCSTITEAGTYNYDDCDDGNLTIAWDTLDAGTYYYAVLADEGCLGPYTLHVVGDAVAAYCKASGDCDNEFISRVTVGNIDNSSLCDGDGYSDYTYLSTTVEPGQSYPITVELGNGITSDVGAVWIDWNQNLTFEYEEEVDLDVFSGEGPYTGNVVTPVYAFGGQTRMRVRINYLSYPPPCGNTSSGEVEDYTIDVLASGCCIGDRGNIQLEPDCYAPDQTVDITDLTNLIDHMFISYVPYCCLEEADIAPAISGEPPDGTVDISDLTALIDHMFINYPPMPPCE